MSNPVTDPVTAVIRLNETTRLAFIPTVLTFAYDKGKNGTFTIEPWDLYPSLGSFLALKHFNERSGAVLPHLPKLLEGCDIQLSTEIFDSHGSPTLAAKYAIQTVLKGKGTAENPNPMAILGPSYSREARAVGIITGVYGVPTISPYAGSVQLDNGSTFPLFARVIPDDRADSNIVVQHFRGLGVTHFGVIFVREEQGIQYAKLIRESAADMNVFTVSFEEGDQASLEGAVKELKNTNLRYFYALALAQDEQLLRAAAKEGMVGADYFWIIGDTALNGMAFDEGDPIISALQGIGFLTMDPDVTGNMEEEFLSFQNESALQDEFISTVKNLDRQVFSDFNLTEQKPVYSWWVTLAYDAMLLPGLAACSIEKDFFTNKELFEAMTYYQFEGASGNVSLDHTTQTRDFRSVRYAMMNMLNVGQGPTPGKIKFKAGVSMYYDLSRADPVIDVAPFIFADNTTTPPLPLPAIEVKQNLINGSLIAVCLTLCAITILTALGWICFTWYYRKARFVRGSQPPFLYMLCVGVIIMAISIIPMSLQEPVPNPSLNIACMAQLWLFSAGFTTIFSALFCKLWRLNKLLASSKKFKRIKIEAKDVLYPFAILLTVNFTLLAVWTAVDPLKWERYNLDSFDSFGRPTATAASCSSESKTNEVIFSSFFVILNATALIIANWQSYLARNLETEFNESGNIAVSMVLLTEAAVLGLPVLFLVGQDAGAFYLVRSFLIVITSIGVLLPIFLPKIALRNRLKLESKRKVTTLNESYMRSINASNLSRYNESYMSTDSSGREETQILKKRRLLSLVPPSMWNAAPANAHASDECDDCGRKAHDSFKLDDLLESSERESCSGNSGVIGDDSPSDSRRVTFDIPEQL